MRQLRTAAIARSLCNMKCNSPALFGAIALALLTAISAARADTVAVSFIGGTQSQPHNLTLGWSFTVSSPISITQLGLWDGPGPGTGGSVGDGFGSAHDVTLWTNAGAALAAANIPAGLSGTLVDGFRYVSIAPLLLLPGTYVISAYYPTSSFDTSISNASSVSGFGPVTYTGSRSVLNNVFPTNNATVPAPNGHFGPNFQFGVATVPEFTSTWPLLLLSFLLLLGGKRMLSAAAVRR
jgi:hypothetical protein